MKELPHEKCSLSWSDQRKNLSTVKYRLQNFALLQSAPFKFVFFSNIGPTHRHHRVAQMIFQIEKSL